MAKFKIKVDNDLFDLIPGYLQRRREEIVQLKTAIQALDYPTIIAISHRIKGSGAGYGFRDLSEYADQLFYAAEKRDQNSCLDFITKIADYVENVEVTNSSH